MKKHAARKYDLPSNGVFFGSCTYPYRHKGVPFLGGRCFTYWVPADPPEYDVVVKLADEENQGNLLEFSYAGGKDMIQLMTEAKKRGIYSIAYPVCSSSSKCSEEELSGVSVVKDIGDMYIGYDFHEAFSMGLYDSNLSMDREMTPEIAAKADLKDIANGFMTKVKEATDARHKAGYGCLMASSASFYIDYEVAAGMDIPYTEDFPFGNITLASALTRGLYRTFQCPLWGSYLAHEWYSFLPHKNPYKMESLRTAFQIKYITGAKIIINESGNWTLQSSLCEDSPMQSMPRATDKLSTPITAEDRPRLQELGKQYVVNISSRAPQVQEYKRIMSEFYDYTKSNPAPAGQPEATIGIAKGYLDLSGSDYVPNSAIVSAFNIAQYNPNWMQGMPEQSFQILMNVLFPKPKMFLPNKNLHFGATPYGQADVVSFAANNVTADFLLKNYKVLIFSGWNSCTKKQYEALCGYVQGGGKLCIALPHLSTDTKRKHNSFELNDLINGGDFSRLCGLKVTGKGARFYWATGPSKKANDLGIILARRFGIMAAPLGELEYTNPPECYEPLAVDDEDMRPVILRCKNGAGEVYFVNTWCYPGSLNLNNGVGAMDDGRGLMDLLFEFAAMQGRGHAWITGPDFETPDEDCKWMVWSYFPDAGKICFLNLDYERERKCVLHYFGDKKFISLQPGELLQINAPKLFPHEKYNER